MKIIEQSDKIYEDDKFDFGDIITFESGKVFMFVCDKYNKLGKYGALKLSKDGNEEDQYCIDYSSRSVSEVLYRLINNNGEPEISEKLCE